MNKRFFSVSVAVLVFVGLVGVTGYVKGDHGTVADEYLSDVSKFVRNLTDLAGKDSNIGLEVNAVAKEQSDGASKSAEAMESVENRNALVTFLFGTDYKSIGVLRSQLVTSQNHIDRLTKAMERAKNGDIKADLQEEIDSLKVIIAKTEAFIKENESKFSVLGWAVKLFAGQ